MTHGTEVVDCNVYSQPRIQLIKYSRELYFSENMDIYNRL